MQHIPMTLLKLKTTVLQIKNCLCHFSGTAAVAVAGIIASFRLSEKKRLADNTFVFLGAGQVCIVKLIVHL